MTKVQRFLKSVDEIWLGTELMIELAKMYKQGKDVSTRDDAIGTISTMIKKDKKSGRNLKDLLSMLRSLTDKQYKRLLKKQS